MQMVMLALVESIRGTLRTAGWKLQSVLASETAQAWIITSNAFTVHASGRTCSLLFFHLNCLPLCLRRLRGNDAVGGFFLPTFYFARFPRCPLFLLYTFFVFLFPLSSSSSVCLSACLSPYTLRSTTQQPLNYSYQTTLCIFLAVPLHSSRMLFPPTPPHPRLIVAVRAHACVHAQLHMFSCLCDPASILIFAASLDGS